MRASTPLPHNSMPGRSPPLTVAYGTKWQDRPNRRPIRFRGRISSEGRFSSSDNLRMLAAMRRASSLIRSLAAGRPLWHFATNNDTTTLAVVADALVSSLRVAAVSPPSVAVWARRCLTRAIHGHPPHTFHSGIGLRSFSHHLMDLHCSKAGDQRGDRPNGVVAIVDIA